VLEASRGDEALIVWKTYPGVIDLVLTDVVVPGMNGPAIVSAIHQAGDEPPRALFMTGYSEHPALREEYMGEAVRVIQKPFSPSELVQRVREALDRPVMSHA
jgi:CheY-like chemotaxis protein